MSCHLFRVIIETSGNIKIVVGIIVDEGVCVLQGEAHGSRVSAEPLAEGPARLPQGPPVQSVFLYRQAERVPDTEGGEARPGAHEASGSLLPVTRSLSADTSDVSLECCPTLVMRCVLMSFPAYLSIGLYTCVFSSFICSP